MKAILLATLLLGAAPTFAQKSGPTPAAGQESPIPFKGANAVVIHTTDSSRVALRKVASQLQQNGFVIDRIDYDLLSLSTKPHAFTKSAAYTMVASATAEADKVVLRGEWHGQVLQYSATEPAAYTNAASKKALAELEAVAQAYAGGKVAYLLRR